MTSKRSGVARRRRRADRAAARRRAERPWNRRRSHRRARRRDERRAARHDHAGCARAAVRARSSSSIARCSRACAPGSSGRPAIRSAMSSSSTPSPTATAAGEPGSARHLDQLSRPDPRAAGRRRLRGPLARAGTTIFPGRTIASASRR